MAEQAEVNPRDAFKALLNEVLDEREAKAKENEDPPNPRTDAKPNIFASLFGPIGA